jgi:hypothetical protein
MKIIICTYSLFPLPIDPIVYFIFIYMVLSLPKYYKNIICTYSPFPHPNYQSHKTSSRLEDEEDKRRDKRTINE